MAEQEEDAGNNRNLEPADPAIKLFGKSIQLPESSSLTSASTGCVAEVGDDVDVEMERPCAADDGDGNGEELDDEDKIGENILEVGLRDVNLRKTKQKDAHSGINENFGTPFNQAKILSASRTEEKSNATVSQEKTLKKPDQIIPCPRCASMDTKFCYFNNYNVKQPRYFCRKCQRYWTSGGTMRNIPVGAGRRKSKSSASQYPEIAVSSGFHGASAQHSKGLIPHPVALNSSVLSFVPDSYRHQISLPKEKVEGKIGQTQTGIKCGSCSPNELKISLPFEASLVSDDLMSGTGVSASCNDKDDENSNAIAPAAHYQSFHPQMVCFPGPLWPPYPWNPAQYNCPIPSPNLHPTGFRMPFYPAAMYWGCTVPGTWNMPYIACPSSPNVQSEQCDAKSPTLRKHPRDDNEVKPTNASKDEVRKEENPKPAIWVPKTLRIDDLEEAAKSSMWATLGIKNDCSLSSDRKEHFKPFSSHANEKGRVANSSSALLANPAALSRSINFHEGS